MMFKYELAKLYHGDQMASAWRWPPPFSQTREEWRSGFQRLMNCHNLHIQPSINIQSSWFVINFIRPVLSTYHLLLVLEHLFRHGMSVRTESLLRPMSLRCLYVDFLPILPRPIRKSRRGKKLCDLLLY